MKLREILERIKEINRVDFETRTDFDVEYDFEWDGSLSYEGIKRKLYSLWNNGENEQGDNLRNWLTKEAKVLYDELVEDVKNIEQPIIKL